MLCGSCDADAGDDERGDVIQGDGGGYEVTHGGNGGAKENTLPTAVEKTTYHKPDGNGNTPDARMANLRVNKAKESLTQSAATTGMP